MIVLERDNAVLINWVVSRKRIFSNRQWRSAVCQNYTVSKLFSVYMPANMLFDGSSRPEAVQSARTRANPVPPHDYNTNDDCQAQAGMSAWCKTRSVFMILLWFCM